MRPHDQEYWWTPRACLHSPYSGIHVGRDHGLPGRPLVDATPLPAFTLATVFAPPPVEYSLHESTPTGNPPRRESSAADQPRRYLTRRARRHAIQRHVCSGSRAIPPRGRGNRPAQAFSGDPNWLAPNFGRGPRCQANGKGWSYDTCPIRP